MIVKPWFAPEFTTTAPPGEMPPFAPALALIVNVVTLVATRAHHVPHLLALLPVLPSSVVARALAYSCSAHKLVSSDGSTCAVLKSPQRLRPVAVLKVL